MTNDILLGFVLILVLIIVHVSNNRPAARFTYGGCEFSCEGFGVTEVPEEVEDVLDIESRDFLCSEIFKTYDGDYGDKRERLVHLLVELSDVVDDTSWFMDEHPHIREYIFDCG